MTKIISSQTSDKKYFLTINSDGHAEACTCGDYTWRQAARGGSCKHMHSFDSEVQRAATFQALMACFDVRSEVQKAARRERYCIEFNVY